MSGRPKANIDWKEVDKLLQAQCESTVIADLLGIERTTLYKRCQDDNNVDYSTYSQQKRSEGKELLRAKQFQMAMGGDRTMLVWLGKQYLKQSDKQETQNLNLDLSALTKEEILEKINELETME